VQVILNLKLTDNIQSHKEHVVSLHSVYRVGNQLLRSSVSLMSLLLALLFF